jgi:acetyl esterase/lipase
VGRRFLKLSATGAALTLNGLRPLPGSNPLSVPSFFAGWLTSELAPHNLAITVAGTSGYLARKRRRGLDRDDWIGLGLNALSIAGLAVLVRQGVKSGEVVEAALTEGLADDYVAKLDPAPTRTDLATPWRHVLLPFRFKDPQVRRVADIPYTPDPPADRKAARRLLLDIYTPREPAAPGERRPVLFQIHGGGWVIGKKDEQGLPLMTHLAARGWVCVAPNYPLSPKATWPEHLIALKRALAWTKENIADYGGDPSFIAVTGGSAGGHLASLVALTADDPSYQPGFEDADTSVQACVPFYGAYDLANVLETKAGDQRLDYFLARTVFKTKDRAVFESATPILRVREDAPRTTRSRRSRRHASSSAGCARSTRNRSSTPSSPVHSTRSTSSTRSAARMSSAPLSDSCAGCTPATSRPRRRRCRRVPSATDSVLGHRARLTPPRSHRWVAVLPLLVLLVGCGGHGSATPPGPSQPRSSTVSPSRSYVALPSRLPAPGVLVLHPWWGLTADVKAYADSLAAAGYVALAPDLYGDGRTARTIADAEALAADHRAASLDDHALAGLNELLARPDVLGGKASVIGFSLGGGPAAELATTAAPGRVNLLVLYYDARIDLPWERLQAPVLGHYATSDPYTARGDVAAMRAAIKAGGGTSRIYVYSHTHHWFAEPSRPQYDPAAAALAWRRTLQALHRFEPLPTR